MKIEVLCTGDEILSGKTVNTNYSHMARKLQEFGFAITWGTTVGDNREELTRAFKHASKRADVVIVNGGLGPTVDDLSQEVAASVAGVELELHTQWHRRIADWYASRGRQMPENNTKQAMLPQGAEFIDNPIGTACGFALDINKARFFFTPGVPRELFKMLQEQVIPRLQKIRGREVVTRVKRFHSFGIGESRADRMLKEIEDLEVHAGIKLGFQSHFPQLETKLTAHGSKIEELNALIEPAQEVVRRQLGNFILCEDDATLEGTIIEKLRQNNQTLAMAETHTAGQIASRLFKADGATETLVEASTSLNPDNLLLGVSESASKRVVGAEDAISLARDLVAKKDVDVGFCVLSDFVDAEDSSEQGMDMVIAIVTDGDQQIRRTKLLGSLDWTRMGATEMALDCLRRYLFDLPLDEKIDFEKQ